MNHNERERFLTKTNLKQRGWTEDMMEELLPQPLIRVNPHCRGKNMYLWKEDDVMRAEKEDAFLSREEKRKTYQIRAQKAVKTKEEKMKTILNQAISKIRVQKLDFEEVTKRALRAKQEWYDMTGQYDRTVRGADERTMQRWTVNYIRHHLSEYDTFLFSVKGRTGISFAYPLYRRAVLDKIAETYPFLCEECGRQAAAMDDSNSADEDPW